MFHTFDIGEVGGREFEEAGAGNAVSEEAAVGGGSGEVVGSRDDQRRDGDRGEFSAGVVVADGGTIGGIAERVGRFDHALSFGDDVRALCSEGGSEPAGKNCGGDVFGAASENGVNARFPRVGGADGCASVAEDKFVEPLGGMNAEPHTGLAAHGEAAEVDAIEAERIEETKNVICKKFDGVRAGSD